MTVPDEPGISQFDSVFFKPTRVSNWIGRKKVFWASIFVA